MTAVDVLGRVDELTDGTGGSVDAVMGAAIGPYRKSRLERLYRDEAVYRDFARAAHQRCLAPDLRWSAAADALLRGLREGRAEPWPRSGGTASS